MLLWQEDKYNEGQRNKLQYKLQAYDKESGKITTELFPN